MSSQSALPVAVVGGGITGLVTARRLATRLAGRRPVILMEASDRLGGAIQTTRMHGIPVELGAEALYLAVPELSALVDELGVHADLVTAGPGGTWLATRHGLTRLPAGVGPAGPTRLRPVLSSHTLSLRGLLRAAWEPVRARRPLGGEVSVAEFVDHRFGREVTATFVDPMMGSLHAGDVRRLSLQATSPMLAAADAGRRSLVRENLLRMPRRTGSSSVPRPAPPSFVSLPDGLESLVTHVLTGVDVQVRQGVAVTSVRPAVGGLDLETDHGTTTVAAAVICTPAPVTANILRAQAPAAAAALDDISMASVATIALRYRASDLARHAAFDGTGILLPSASGRTMKAAVFLSAKWPHVAAAAGPDQAVVRVSAGRAGSDVAERLSDDDLVRAVRADLTDLTGLTAEPEQVEVRRWPRSMPQLEIGHQQRISTARSALAGVFLAGASCDGVGITSCVKSAEQAARDVLEHLQGRGEGRGEHA